ncbi:hypothetical protein evm_007677 [Chilo suppressalis]|nr:hypothetical protein evm_007677 [Chilo suppressalis]
MIGLILLTICALYSELEFVLGFDRLDFWVRDPKIDESRRNILDPGQRSFHFTKINKDRTKQSTVKTIGSHIPNSTKAHPTHPQRVTKKVIIPRSEDVKQNKSTPRPGPGESPVWPRAHKRYKIQDALRSTMMTSPDSIPLQSAEKDTTKPPPKEYDFLRPYTIKQQLEQFAAECNDANITIDVLGRTIEYHDIVLMKITEKKPEADRHFRADDNKYADDVPDKKIIFIVHALSLMGVMNLYCLKEFDQFKVLLSYYFAHLDKFDIFLIPLANPDGFIDAITHRPHTNKNKSPQAACPGVALDRNFEVAWNYTSSISSCSSQYPGPKPFSEPESRAVRDVLHRYSHKIFAYIHVHGGAYDSDTFKGDAVLYPKGYSESQSDDDKYMDLRGELDEAMKNASFHFITVAVEPLYSWYGKVSGTSVDYASSVYGIPYAMEFVMQPYVNVYFEKLGLHPYENSHRISRAALEEIWQRIINVTFSSMWRNMKNNDI